MQLLVDTDDDKEPEDAADDDCDWAMVLVDAVVPTVAATLSPAVLVPE